MIRGFSFVIFFLGPSYDAWARYEILRAKIEDNPCAEVAQLQREILTDLGDFVSSDLVPADLTEINKFKYSVYQHDGVVDEEGMSKIQATDDNLDIRRLIQVVQYDDETGDRIGTLRYYAGRLAQIEGSTPTNDRDDRPVPILPLDEYHEEILKDMYPAYLESGEVGGLATAFGPGRDRIGIFQGLHKTLLRFLKTREGLNELYLLAYAVSEDNQSLFEEVGYRVIFGPDRLGEENYLSALEYSRAIKLHFLKRNRALDSLPLYDYEGRLESLQNSLTIDTPRVWQRSEHSVRVQKVELLHRLGRFKEADKDLKRLLNAMPGDPKVHWLRVCSEVGQLFDFWNPQGEDTAAVLRLIDQKTAAWEQVPIPEMYGPNFIATLSARISLEGGDLQRAKETLASLVDLAESDPAKYYSIRRDLLEDKAKLNTSIFDPAQDQANTTEQKHIWRRVFEQMIYGVSIFNPGIWRYRAAVEKKFGMKESSNWSSKVADEFEQIIAPLKQ